MQRSVGGFVTQVANRFVEGTPLMLGHRRYSLGRRFRQEPPELSWHEIRARPGPDARASSARRI